MANLVSRSLNFMGRARMLGRVTRNPVGAAFFLLRARGNRKTMTGGRFAGHDFRFRGFDVNAVQEVLLAREYAFLDPVLKSAPVPLVLDIGAHIGLFSLWALSVNPAARVFSVEASPETFAVLQENIAARGASWSAVHAAAWSRDENLSFSATQDSMSHKVLSSGELTVRGTTMPRIFELAGVGAEEPVDLMKIDIEGAEEQFLCAFPDFLRRVKNLVVELHPGLCDTDRVHALLAENFSHIENMGGRKSSKPLLFCRRGG